MSLGYSIHPDPDKTSRALGKELAVKPKHCVEVCRAIRGRSLDDAKEYLEGVMDKRWAVPFRRHKYNYPHQKGVGPGAFPKKAAGEILKLLKHAESNAEYKGLDVENLHVLHAATHRAGVLPGSMPRARGRATPFNKTLSHVEIVLEEREDERASAADVKAKAKAEARAEAKAKSSRSPAKAKRKPGKPVKAKSKKKAGAA